MRHTAIWEMFERYEIKNGNKNCGEWGSHIFVCRITNDVSHGVGSQWRWSVGGLDKSRTLEPIYTLRCAALSSGWPFGGNER